MSEETNTEVEPSPPIRAFQLRMSEQAYQQLAQLSERTGLSGAEIFTHAMQTYEWLWFNYERGYKRLTLNDKRKPKTFDMKDLLKPKREDDNSDSSGQKNPGWDIHPPRDGS